MGRSEAISTPNAVSSYDLDTCGQDCLRRLSSLKPQANASSVNSLNKDQGMEAVLQFDVESDIPSATNVTNPSPLVYRSEELLKEQSEFWIEHAGKVYRVQLTRLGKLIMTK